MNNPNPTSASTLDKATSGNSQPSVFRCISGSLVAGGFATACYFLTASIAQTFANKPIHSDNMTVLNIASAVRTLVVGICTLGTAVFAIASAGLMALGLQILIQQLTKKTAEDSKS